ncbi:MAG: acyl-CoA thioesterase [Ignavibacteriales bacterium]|jgi:acyl-CoA hydrolase|nr:acyl-CoA thioesterase [Ignavibacteriaceae bacterium]NLH61287.1 acyl-CoA thioesterase [Ignavibacteriales bacterium]HOJ19011.1 acyl-CoA thioesterase [Ignavibacteriaceae bacterium]HPO54598.1 acyl-CoA thioesterase [Ignavibacteriaceae bacterium]
MTPKKVSDSTTIMTELVLPQHTNTLGNLLGGELMHWIDICAGICAFRHAQNVCVTAAVDSIHFHHPIKLGQIVTLKASINRAFNSSMEIGVEVFSDSYTDGKVVLSNSAFITFVSIDKDGKPLRVPPVTPETPEEQKRFDEALGRREKRLQADR